MKDHTTAVTIGDTVTYITTDDPTDAVLEVLDDLGLEPTADTLDVTWGTTDVDVRP